VKTRLLSAKQETIMESASIIRAGGLVAYPTDTLYGLGADGLSPGAIERVFDAKGRDPGAPVPLLLAGSEDLAAVATDISIAAWRLAAVFWPGALTLVLRKGPRVPAAVSAGGDTVALRVPNHPVALALLRAVGGPIAGTSANRSGARAPLNADEVLAELDGRIDAVLDGGPCPGGVQSTVVDISGPRPRLIRGGAIHISELEDVLEVPLEP
jgi:L-threonylcarbamoyladenylate synthase